MKKYVIASIVLCILATIGIVVYFSFPKGANKTKLVVEASDICLELDEHKKIEYECSIVEAVISFDVDDESVAYISAGAKGVEVVGKSTGNTTLTIVATYKKEVFEKEIKVTVVEQQESPEDSPESGENNPTTPPSGGNEGGDLENPDADEKVPMQLIIPAENLVNCQVEGTVITVEISRKALFSISSDQNLTKEVVIINENTELTISEEKYVGNNTFSILASSRGEFEITIVLEDEYEFSYIVKVI